jgi:hypothetical protein
MRSLPSLEVFLFHCNVQYLSENRYTCTKQVGPFMALEQSIVSDLLPPSLRTSVFAWYNLLGYMATAIGSLAAGHFCDWAQRGPLHTTALGAYRYDGKSCCRICFMSHSLASIFLFKTSPWKVFLFHVSMYAYLSVM